MSLAALGGSATYNSYLSVAEADAIAATQLGELAWNTATNDEKERALINATFWLDTLDYIGSKTDPTQPLKWPRTGASCGDKSYANDVIPKEIEMATFYLAEALLGDPGIISGIGGGDTSTGTPGEIIPGVPNKDLKSLKLDVMELVWKDDATGSSIVKTPLTVMPFLANVLGCLTTSVVGGGSSWMVKVVRG